MKIITEHRPNPWFLQARVAIIPRLDLELWGINYMTLQVLMTQLYHKLEYVNAARDEIKECVSETV